MIVDDTFKEELVVIGEFGDGRESGNHAIEDSLLSRGVGGFVIATDGESVLFHHNVLEESG